MIGWFFCLFVWTLYIFWIPLSGRELAKVFSYSAFTSFFSLLIQSFWFHTFSFDTSSHDFQICWSPLQKTLVSVCMVKQGIFRVSDLMLRFLIQRKLISARCSREPSFLLPPVDIWFYQHHFLRSFFFLQGFETFDVNGFILGPSVLFNWSCVVCCR